MSYTVIAEATIPRVSSRAGAASRPPIPRSASACATWRTPRRVPRRAPRAGQSGLQPGRGRRIRGRSRSAQRVNDEDLPPDPKPRPAFPDSRTACGTVPKLAAAGPRARAAPGRAGRRFGLRPTRSRTSRPTRPRSRGTPHRRPPPDTRPKTRTTPSTRCRPRSNRVPPRDLIIAPEADASIRPPRTPCPSNTTPNPLPLRRTHDSSLCRPRNLRPNPPAPSPGVPSVFRTRRLASRRAPGDTRVRPRRPSAGRLAEGSPVQHTGPDRGHTAPGESVSEIGRVRGVRPEQPEIRSRRRLPTRSPQSRGGLPLGLAGAATDLGRSDGPIHRDGGPSADADRAVRPAGLDGPRHPKDPSGSGAASRAPKPERTRLTGATRDRPQGDLPLRRSPPSAHRLPPARPPRPGRSGSRTWTPTTSCSTSGGPGAATTDDPPPRGAPEAVGADTQGRRHRLRGGPASRNASPR